MNKTVVFAVVALAVWLAVAAYAMSPGTSTAYTETAATSAQDTLSAVRTLETAARAELDNRVLPPYLAVIGRNAREEVVTARSTLAEAPLPGDGPAQLRDELTLLMVDALRQIDAVDRAVGTEDPQALESAVEQLRTVGDRLDGILVHTR